MYRGAGQPSQRDVTIIVQNWEESERGWGTRPDGYTVHANLEAREKYVKDHIAWLRKQYGDVAPHEYTRVDGDPIHVKVSVELYNKIEKAFEKKKVLWGRARYYNSQLDLEKELFD